MIPILKTIPPKKLIGKHLKMSMTDNKTAALWQSFMQRRNEIKNRLTTDFISMEVFPSSYSFSNFDPNAEFEKWAVVEVGNFDNIPDEMETFHLTGGLYTVFHYKGLSNDPSIFRYIYGTWLPGSEFDLDDRPHFEILGEKYRNNDPNSEEEIWIPVKLKKSLI
jgi:AraC family transcriptional regulator